MNQQSALQQKYPLSPKKFWKKIIASIPVIIFVGLFFSGIVLIFVVSGNDAGDMTVTVIQWVLLGIVPALIYVVLYVWYIKVYIRRYYYDGNEDFLTIKKGVFMPAEIHVQYQKIQDVYVDQDILDRFMGLYDVHIASATVSSGIAAHIDGVEFEQAEGLKNFLLNKIKGGSAPHEKVETARQSQATHPSFSEEISSTAFPFSSNFIVARVLGIIFGSIFTVAIIALLVFGKSESLTLTTLHWGRFLFFAGIAWLVIAICRTVYFLIWKTNYEFKFAPEYIFMKQGVISRQEKHVPYNTIQDVTVSQGIIDRILGISNVMIENAANSGMRVGKNGKPVFTGILIVGQTATNAQKIAESLKKNVLGKGSGRTGL